MDSADYNHPVFCREGRGSQGRIQEFGKGGHSTVRGAAPGRVRGLGTPPTQLGGTGERCKLPYRGFGGYAPEANAFCVETALKTTQKKASHVKLYCLYACNACIF